jgi:TolA-binding protein
MALCELKHMSNAAGNIKDDEAYWAFLIDMSNAELATAISVSYSNATSGISATNVQAAIDLLETQIVSLNTVNVRQGNQIGNIPMNGNVPVKSLQQQISDNDVDITSIQSTNTTQTNNIAALTAKDTDLQAQITALKTQVDAIPIVTFPTGTRMTFIQAAPPVGWTATGAYHDRALRLVGDASGGQSGGTSAFSVAFGATTTGSHVLTIAELPAHDHGLIYGGLNGGGNPATDSWFFDHAYDDTGPYYRTKTASGSVGSNIGHTHTLGAVTYVNACVGVKT